MIIFCFSFGGMLYVVSDANSDDMKLEPDYIDQIDALEKSLSLHPVYYGLKTISKHTDFWNTSQGEVVGNALAEMSSKLRNITNPRNVTD